MPYKSRAQAGYFHTHKAQLEREGVMKFIEPFDKMQTWLEERRRAKRAS